MRKPALYKAPKGNAPPPLWIRGLLILTCTGVSFCHGSNDGQKGMGLIMLILIGTVPTAYALNRALPDSHVATFVARLARPPRRSSTRTAPATAIIGDPRPAVTDYVHAHKITEGTYPSLAVLVKRDRRRRSQQYGSLAKVPADKVGNTSATTCIWPRRRSAFLAKDKESELTARREVATLNAYKKQLDQLDQVHPDLGQDRASPSRSASAR